MKDREMTNKHHYSMSVHHRQQILKDHDNTVQTPEMIYSIIH